MPSPAIKICGIATAAALDAAVEAGADHVGLVFFPPSPRAVSLADASALTDRAGDAIGRVGLFVDAQDRAIADAVEAGRLTALQLHGKETPERAGHLRARFGLPVWKALPVAKASDVEAAERYRDAADLVLFDAKTPNGAALPGGMGLRFDWSLLAARPKGMRWGLAGGLSPANVAEAVAATGAPLVDTSSGVETAPGAKDADLIRAFCQAVRSTD